MPTLSHLAGATGFGRDDLLPRFQGPRALGFIQDPSMGALDRHWLVGDPDGLKAVPARGGSVATLAATRVGVSAIAARPPGADPGAPWPVVFAQPQEPPEVPGPARWPGEERGSCLRVLGTDGQVRTLAGALQENPREPRFRDGPADEARFGRVVGLAMDASGAVFVADAGNAMLRRLGPDGRVTTLSMQGFEALPEPGADAEILPTLTGLGVDPATGDLLVSDSTCLYRYTQAGLCTPLFSPDDEADGAARRSRRRPSYGLQRLTGLTVFGDYVLLTMQGPIPIWAFHLPTGRRAPLLGWDQPRTRLGPLRSCAPGLAPEACAALDRPCALAVNAEGACALALEGGLAHLDLAAALGVLFPP